MSRLPVQLDALRRQRFVDGLFREHATKLVSWLKNRYGAGPPEPEDVAQGAFTALSAFERIDEIRNPKAFLYTVAANQMLKGIKWQVRLRRTIDSDLQLFNENVEEITPERLYVAGERLEGLRKALASLTPKQREILLRSRLQGQTYQEIRAQTGWSDADISRQLKQVLMQLRTFRPGAEGEESEGSNER